MEINTPHGIRKCSSDELNSSNRTWRVSSFPFWWHTESECGYSFLKCPTPPDVFHTDDGLLVSRKSFKDLLHYTIMFRTPRLYFMIRHVVFGDSIWTVIRFRYFHTGAFCTLLLGLGVCHTSWGRCVWFISSTSSSSSSFVNSSSSSFSSSSGDTPDPDSCRVHRYRCTHSSRVHRHIGTHRNLNNWTWWTDNFMRSRRLVDLQCGLVSIVSVFWSQYTLSFPCIPPLHVSSHSKKWRDTITRTSSE